MAAPVCGCSIMSRRSVVLKRPLRARSSLTSCATSNEPASGALKGTMAMGMGSACPFVLPTTSSATPGAEINSRTIGNQHERRLFIGLEPKYEVSFEQRRIRGIRQGRCTIHRILDRLAGGGVAVALGDARAGHLAARNLGDFDQTIKPDARRRRLDPGVLDSIAEFSDIAVAQRAGLDRAAMLLVGQLPAQFRLAVLARALVGRTLGVGDLLGLGSLLGLRRLLGFGGFVGFRRALGLFGEISLRRAPRRFLRRRLLRLAQPLLLGRGDLGGIRRRGFG